MGDTSVNPEKDKFLKQQMLQHALAFATGSQYARNPEMLSHQQDMRFDQLPTEKSNPESPAESVVAFQLSFEEDNKAPQRGHYYTPSNNRVSFIEFC